MDLAETPTPAVPPPRSPLGYQPGLDGLRGLAVVVVVLFHLELGWARGGFLGLGVFFVLSGTLITRLMMDEAASKGRLSLTAFWGRRVRRLAPASLVCLLLVAVAAHWMGAGTTPGRTRLDILAALGYVANWRFVAVGESYADIFLGGPSPVLHYWSLAIEEQFYLLFPLLAGGSLLLVRRARSWWPFVAVLGTLWSASLAAALLTDDRNLGYYGTHVRAAELLAGCLLAVWLARRPLPGPRAAAVLGGVSLGALVAVTAVVHQSDRWLYRGGFAGLALVWCALVVAAVAPGGFRRALSWAPLVQLGRISFGVYLYHWPVFLLLTADRVGFGGFALVAVRLAVTLTLAVLSYRFVEQPIRERRVRFGSGRGVAVVFTAVAVVLAATFVTLPERGANTLAAAAVTAPDSVVSFGPVPTSIGIGASDTGVTSTTVAPPLLALVGSDAAAASEVARTVGGYRVVDRTIGGCPALVATGDDCPLPSVPVGTAAVVLLIGQPDHQALDERSTAATGNGAQALVASLDATHADALARLTAFRSSAGSVPVFTIDTARTADAVSDALQMWSLSDGDAEEVTLADVAARLPASEGQSVATTHTATVLVIGDSTSYAVAAELDRQVGATTQVVWAGGRNCPLVATVQLRWWAGLEFDTGHCPRLDEWQHLVSELHPGVLLVVESLPSHSEQRYDVGGRWYSDADAEFRRRHDEVLAALRTAMDAVGGSVAFTDSAYARWSNRDRVDRWNEILAEWDFLYADVSVVPIASLVADQVAARGDTAVQPDGIHLDDATLELVVRQSLVPALQRLGG